MHTDCATEGIASPSCRQKGGGGRAVGASGVGANPLSRDLSNRTPTPHMRRCYFSAAGTLQTVEFCPPKFEPLLHEVGQRPLSGASLCAPFWFPVFPC